MRTRGSSDAENVQSIFGERASFVKAADVDFAANVDATGRDAVDSEFTKARDGEARADGERGGQCGRNNDGDEIERAKYDSVPWDLKCMIRTRYIVCC